MQKTKEMRVPTLGQEDPLEEGKVTHSSILAWSFPQTEEPGGLQSMGCKEPDTAEGTERIYTETLASVMDQLSVSHGV